MDRHLPRLLLEATMIGIIPTALVIYHFPLHAVFLYTPPSFTLYETNLSLGSGLFRVQAATTRG